MNETRTRGGPNLGLLLLIPAVVIIAKGAMRRRAMMDAGWSAPGAGVRRYGQHRFAGPEGVPGPLAFDPPPWIVSALDAWHTRAHQAPDATTPDPAPEPGATTA